MPPSVKIRYHPKNLDKKNRGKVLKAIREIVVNQRANAEKDLQLANGKHLLTVVLVQVIISYYIKQS